jgi:hypothetical protein
LGTLIGHLPCYKLKQKNKKIKNAKSHKTIQPILNIFSFTASGARAALLVLQIMDP